MYPTKTNPDEISLDEQLWHGNRVGAAETFPDLLLHFPAHENVPFHILDQMGPQDLSHLETPLVRVSDNAHGGRVQNDFASFLFLPCLKNDTEMSTTKKHILRYARNLKDHQNVIVSRRNRFCQTVNVLLGYSYRSSVCFCLRVHL